MTDIATLEADLARLRAVKSEAEALGASAHIILSIEGAIILMETAIGANKSLKATVMAFKSHRRIMAPSAILAVERDVANTAALAMHCWRALAGFNEVSADERLEYLREALRIMVELSRTMAGEFV